MKPLELRIAEGLLNTFMFSVCVVIALLGGVLGIVLRPWRIRQILVHEADYIKTEWAMLFGWYPTEQGIIASMFIAVGVMVVWAVVATLHTDPRLAYAKSMGPSGCISADAKQYQQAIENPCCRAEIIGTNTGYTEYGFNFDPAIEGCR